MWAKEEEVGDGFTDLCGAVWAEWGVRTFYSVKNKVAGDVGGAELDEEAGLSTSELIDDVQVVIRGERGVYRI